MKKITEDDISKIRQAVVDVFPALGVREVAFAVLLDAFDDAQMAADAIFPNKGVSGRDTVLRDDITRLRRAVRQAASQDGKPAVLEKTISKEENRAELIRMIEVIKRDMDNGDIERKDGLKMIADIRVKLNDKFEIEEQHTQRRLIVVPQKRDIICAHTQRECTYWPTKEACMQHYNLTEK